MSGLIGGLLNQARALNAQSAGLQVAGKNLANVNNPNYSRQRVNLSSIDSGVELTSITDTRNKLIDGQIMREMMNKGLLTSQGQISSTLQSLLGEQVDINGTTKTGLASALDDFFNSFSALAANPSEAANKQQVMGAAQKLVDQLNFLSTKLTALSTDTSNEIADQTSRAQGVLQDIATLNQQIAQIEVGHPGGALDLKNQRQAKIEELAGYMNFTVTDSPKGLGQIQINNGSTILVDATQVNGTLAYTGTGFTGGLGAVALGVTTGSLAGLNTSKNTHIASLQTSLDNIASQLVTSVNTAYNGNFFRVDSLNTTLYKSAATIQLTPGLDYTNLQTGSSGESGANDLALAIAALANNNFGGANPVQGTFFDYYNKQVSQIGQRLSTIETQQQGSDLVQNMLVSQRQSESGVSTDEEASNLIVFQRAFQGNSRVIAKLDEMLQTVIDMVR